MTAKWLVVKSVIGPSWARALLAIADCHSQRKRSSPVGPQPPRRWSRCYSIRLGTPAVVAVLSATDAYELRAFLFGEVARFTDPDERRAASLV